MAPPHSWQAPSYLWGKESHLAPLDAPLLLRETWSHLEAWMGPVGSRKLPVAGENPQLRSPFLCALCSLKIQSILLVVPSSTPASERGRRRWGVIRNPDCSKKLPCRRPSCNRAPHCLRRLHGGSFLGSRWLLGVRRTEIVPPAPRSL